MPSSLVIYCPRLDVIGHMFWDGLDWFTVSNDGLVRAQAEDWIIIGEF